MKYVNMKTINREKKVLMLYPEVPVSYWSFKHALEFVNKKSAFPPLGLLTIAALLPEDYKVKLIDLNVSPLSEQSIADADLIFISAMIIQKDSFGSLVEICNRLGKPVVAGGPYPTSAYMDIEGVDHFVLNEAEITLPQFIADYENGKAKKVYTSEVKPDLNMTPAPMFELLELEKYTTMMLQYSRGCPFNCEFCDIIELFGRYPRVKDTAQFVGEMNVLFETGFRGDVFIVDDNFIGNKRRVKELLPEVIRFQKEHGYPFKLVTEASINLAEDETLMDMMVDAGFEMIFLGIETPDKDALAAAQKIQNTKIDALESIHVIQRKGIEVSGGFILGFDNERENIFDRQIEFIGQSAIPMAMVGLLTALPKTQLYRRLKSENRILNESSGNNTHDLQLNFIPTMDEDILIEGYKRVIKTIYQPKNYFDRCYDMIRLYPPVPKRPHRVFLSQVMQDLRGLTMSIRRQLFSPYGLDYLKFVLKSLFTRPALFQKAMKKAVLGYHFFNITDEIVRLDSFNSYLSEKMVVLKTDIDKIDTVNGVESVVALLRTHRKVMKKALRDIAKENHKTSGQLGSNFALFVENANKFFNGLNDLLAAKTQTIRASLSQIKLPELKIELRDKIRKILAKNTKMDKNIRLYIRDAYLKTEELARRLIRALETTPGVTAV